jgi:hypothetical protein
MIKKLLTAVLLLVASVSAFAKCDFSKVTLQQWNSGTYYKWYLKGWDVDSCKSLQFLMYDNQTKKIDTLYQLRNICQVSFGKPGTYKLYVKLVDKCNRCDTALVRTVEIQRWAPKASYLSKTINCDSLVGEMTKPTTIDTCYQYYYTLYHGTELDSLTSRQWDTMTDMELANTYSWDQNDIHYFSDSSRVIKYKFPHNGRFLLLVQYYNKCNEQDTFFIRRYTINCNSSSVQSLIKPEPKVIGVYDIMGRPVYHIRKEEVLIYLYDNGATKKVYITE